MEIGFGTVYNLRYHYNKNAIILHPVVNIHQRADIHNRKNYLKVLCLQGGLAYLTYRNDEQMCTVYVHLMRRKQAQ